MITELHKRLLIVASVLLLGGCASRGLVPEPAPQAEPKLAAFPGIATALGESAEGRVLTLDDPELGNDKVSTGSPYQAASGKICKRLYNAANNELLPRVVCQSTNGEWYLQRSLSLVKNNSTRRASVPTTIVSAQAIGIVRDDTKLANDSDGESASDIANYQVDTQVIDQAINQENQTHNSTVKRQVENGETLWSFTQRLTGSGFNWHQVAEVNNIDDARELEDDAILLVPVGLLKEGQ